MGDQQTKFEFEQFLLKFLMWIGYAAIGVIGKIAFDANNNRLTRKKIIVKSVLSIVIGIISGLACEAFGVPQWEKFVIPVSTLLGESIIVYLMTDFKDIIERFLPNSSNKKKK